jgi:surface protein
MPILSNNNKILSNRDNSGEWRRPEDWLPMPTGITESDQIFVGLHAVIENSDNYVAFLFTTSAGQYQVNWGDGTVTLHNSNTVAQYQYNFATVSNTTLTSRGYKQAMITVTAVSGNLLTCNLQQRFVTSPVQNQAYSTGFLDCILSMPNASTGQSIIFGGVTVRHSYCERADIKTIGNATNVTNMFTQCRSLQSVPLFNTENVTIMTSMFNFCLSLKSVPLFNTSNVTSMANMFNECKLINSIPFFDTSNVTTMQNMFFNSGIVTIPLLNTSNVTNMNSMFLNCALLKIIPLLNTASVTNIVGMFQSCVSLQSVPLFNTASVTNMDNMFFNCNSLNSIPALSTASITTTTGSNFNDYCAACNTLNRIQVSFARQTNISSCQLSRDALVEIFTNLVDRSSTTSANINITGNWGATALSSIDRDIALNKNWTITG